MAGTEGSPQVVILTGPESTGKSMLSEALANTFGGKLVPEYAREYLPGLGRQYEYRDVLTIAEKQLSDMQEGLRSNCNLLVFDTYLIITKVWFEFVFGKYPAWIDTEIARTGNVLYLLCRPDIPWEPDPLRENGGEMREILFHRYERELVDRGLNYYYIEGVGNLRVENAIDQVNKYLRRMNMGNER